MGKHCPRKLCTTQDPCSACQHLDDVGIDYETTATTNTLAALDAWYDARQGDRHPAEAALRQAVRALRRARAAQNVTTRPVTDEHTDAVIQRAIQRESKHYHAPR